MSYDHAKHFVEQLMISAILYILISRVIDALNARKRQLCVRLEVKITIWDRLWIMNWYFLWILKIEFHTKLPFPCILRIDQPRNKYHIHSPERPLFQSKFQILKGGGSAPQTSRKILWNAFYYKNCCWSLSKTMSKSSNLFATYFSRLTPRHLQDELKDRLT